MANNTIPKIRRFANRPGTVIGKDFLYLTDMKKIIVRLNPINSIIGGSFQFTGIPHIFKLKIRRPIMTITYHTYVNIVLSGPIGINICAMVRPAKKI
jgi:hypothetical protein